ncbi:MAG TPA: lipid-binding SYLF domain-containing protein [Terracidiphilus sp.]|nr:lipid-binding SYLF domain-containing protein [Terracidiphilus sp.]
MKKVAVLLCLLAMTTSMSWASASSERQDVANRLQSAGQVLDAIMAAPDKGIPQEVLEKAKCIAVVPKLLKGGFVFGGEGGVGVASCKTGNGWSAPAFFNIGGGSWGLQIGGEDVNLVMVIMNDQGMQELMSSKVQLGAGASVAAGPVGRHASASTSWKMNTAILTYSRAKGIFGGLTLHGAVITRNKDDMNAVYGPDTTTKAVLDGQVKRPEIAHPFISAIHDAMNKAQASGE